MSCPPGKPDEQLPLEFTRGFDGHRRAQAGQGLRMTPAERLRWLEETMETLRRWQGRARNRAARSNPDEGDVF